MLKIGANPAAKLFFKYNSEDIRLDNVWFALPEYLARFWNPSFIAPIAAITACMTKRIIIMRLIRPKSFMPLPEVCAALPAPFTESLNLFADALAFF